MGKNDSGSTEGSLFETTRKEVLTALESGERKDFIIMVVPSHDKENKPLPDQNMWAEAAAEVLADIYGGATAFKALSGIFKTDEGKILRDEPILLESYADREDVLEEENLGSLLRFAIRMGREARQDTVAVVINDFMHFISTKSL